jgi:hypothetical protein
MFNKTRDIRENSWEPQSLLLFQMIIEEMLNKNSYKIQICLPQANSLGGKQVALICLLTQEVRFLQDQ